MNIDLLWIIFSLSFLIALTGAISPGPLFTYTIIKSIQKKRYGFLIGVWVILGHALLELCIIFVLLLGFAQFLSQTYILIGIGVFGCALLLFFGLSIIRDVLLNKIATDFLSDSPTDEFGTNQSQSKNVIQNPILGGVVVSMSNPYWWFWWAAVGFAFIVEYNISFQQIDGLIAFFLGHELGDLIWYVFVATLASLGRRTLNKKTYYIILFICGCFMIGFGLYLGISPFFKYL